VTPYQKEHVIKLRSEGKTFKQIAEILGVNINTAAKHYYVHGKRPS
jgi:DNA-binding CsgD family transcriptional regulator